MAQLCKKSAGFAGLQNYQKVADPVFRESIGNTPLYFTVTSVIFHLLVGLAFALLLNSPLANSVLRSVLRVLFILPWLFTAVIIAIIWRLLLDPNGVISSVLITLHIVGFKVEWFSSPTTALHAVTFVNIWAVWSALYGEPRRPAGHRKGGSTRPRTSTAPTRGRSSVTSPFRS